MSKIDLSAKFFHGIEWDGTDDSRIRTLEKILRDGKILSPRDVAIKNGHFPVLESYKIFLSVHPYGIYSTRFTGDEEPKARTGYDMTTSSFYFILKNRLIRNLNIEPGTFPLECTVEEPIDLKKYLVGVGNAGYDINPNLIMCYYYTMYLKGHISQKDMLIKMRNCLNPGVNYLQYQNDQVILGIIDDWAHLNGRFYGDTEYNRVIETVYEQSPEEFLDPKYYDTIKKMFERYGFNTKYYDFEGYSIEPEKQLVKVHQMQQYIRKNAS